MFKEIVFPEKISYGATGGPSFSTDIVVIRNGNEKRNTNWSVPLYKFEVATGIKTQEQLEELVAFFYEVEGMTYGFRFKDWSDFQITRNMSAVSKEQTMNYTDTLPLYKKYGGNSRRIRKPELNGFRLFKNNTEISEYSLDANNGIVQLLNPIANFSLSNVINNNSQYLIIDTVENNNLAVNDYIQLKNLWGGFGTDYDYLLTNAFKIVQKNSANRITIDTLRPVDFEYYSSVIEDRVIKNIEPTDIITFSCNFHVPCRFETDSMYTSINNYNAYSWNQIPLKEIRL